MICDSSGFEPRKRHQHDDAIGHFSGRVHVMRDDNTGHRISPPRSNDQFIDHVAHDGVQSGRRFVVHDQFGIHDQCPRQADSFSHAAGQFSRFLENDGIGQSDFRKSRQAPFRESVHR